MLEFEIKKQNQRYFLQMLVCMCVDKKNEEKTFFSSHSKSNVLPILLL